MKNTLKLLAAAAALTAATGAFASPDDGRADTHWIDHDVAARQQPAQETQAQDAPASPAPDSYGETGVLASQPEADAGK
jgi:hypothetical protein